MGTIILKYLILNQFLIVPLFGACLSFIVLFLYEMLTIRDFTPDEFNNFFFGESFFQIDKMHIHKRRPPPIKITFANYFSSLDMVHSFVEFTRRFKNLTRSQNHVWQRAPGNKIATTAAQSDFILSARRLTDTVVFVK